MDEPRDVIARAIAPGAWAALDEPNGFSDAMKNMARTMKPESLKRADAILAALSDAGYMIVSIPPPTHVP